MLATHLNVIITNFSVSSLRYYGSVAILLFFLCMHVFSMSGPGSS